MDLKNFLLNEKEIRRMLTKEMLPIGNIKLDKLTFPNLKQIGNLSGSAYLIDAETTNHLAMNERALKVNALESQEEFEGKDLFDAEKMCQKRNPKAIIQWAHKSVAETEHVLSQGKLMLYSPNPIVDENGYCTVRPALKMPVFEGKKAKAVFITYIGLTRYEHVENLYNRYKAIYKNDIQKGNRLFLEYLGLPVHEYPLAKREIETLIALAKYRTNKDAARSLGLSSGTIEGYIHRIKSRLNNANLKDILLYFTTVDRRKF